MCALPEAQKEKLRYVDKDFEVLLDSLMTWGLRNTSGTGDMRTQGQSFRFMYSYVH